MPAMVSSSRIFMFFFPIFQLLIITHGALAQPPFLSYTCSKENGNYNGVHSTYHTNLNILLSSLVTSKNGNGYGFYTSSYGQNNYDDQIYAMGLCRGDASAYVCRSCLEDSRHALTRLCPNQKEATGWYDNCMLRYSNRPVYGIMETKPGFYWYNVQYVSYNSAGFFQELRKLLENLISEAATGGSLRKFAIGNTSVPAVSHQTIYALAQCTPDLSDRECNDCLVGAFEELPVCCGGRKGARVMRASCNLRYELYLFYEPTTVAPLPLPLPLPTPKSPPPRFFSSSVKFFKKLLRDLSAIYASSL